MYCIKTFSHWLQFILHYFIRSTPFDKTPPNKIHLIDENGSAFPEYLQSDSLFPEKMVSNAHPSIVSRFSFF